MIIKVCFEPLPGSKSYEIVAAYITGVFFIIVSVLTALGALCVIVLTIICIACPDDTGDTPIAKVRKVKGQHNKVAPILTNQSNSTTASPISESPCNGKQLDDAHVCKVTLENNDRLSVVCSNSNGKTQAKSPSVDAAVIGPSDVNGGKWQSGEAAVVCSKEQKEERLPPAETNVDCPPPSYAEVTRGKCHCGRKINV
ncbi:hypothetical protein Btru_074773 [Bulinus truncatus]|nr:hypothetical protein Btru_074773 [Bulinus truncatus]